MNPYNHSTRAYDRAGLGVNITVAVAVSLTGHVADSTGAYTGLSVPSCLRLKESNLPVNMLFYFVCWSRSVKFALLLYAVVYSLVWPMQIREPLCGSREHVFSRNSFEKAEFRSGWTLAEKVYFYLTVIKWGPLRSYYDISLATARPDVGLHTCRHAWNCARVAAKWCSLSALSQRVVAMHIDSLYALIQ